jgi:hypothetical protein
MKKCLFRLLDYIKGEHKVRPYNAAMVSSKTPLNVGANLVFAH